MIKKCGIIYYDVKENKYLLVYGKKSDKWGFPKGHQENEETEEETAIREFQEETGIMILKNNLNEKVRFKNNIYFQVNTEIKSMINIQDTKEILKASWFSMNEIIQIPKYMMNYGLKCWLNEKKIETEYRRPKFINNLENKR